MKKINNKFLQIFYVILLIISLTSCSISRGLITEEISADKIKGTFNVILYGNRFSGDLENVAILDIEGDKYTFEVFAPDFDYRIIPNISIEEAVRKAELFVATYGGFKYPQISQIKDFEGNVIGYEFRPLYSPSEFGFFDVLDINYWITGNKIKVKINLVPEVKRLFLNDEFPSSESE